MNYVTYWYTCIERFAFQKIWQSESISKIKNKIMVWEEKPSLHIDVSLVYLKTSSNCETKEK